MYKKVFLTGAGGGIGSHLVEVFRKKGVRVIASDCIAKESLKVEVDDYFQIDLSKLDQIVHEFEKVYKKHPDIDLVINNAGIAHLKGFLSETPEEFEKVMDVNFNSLVISCRYWLNKFKYHSNRGIANMASMAGHISPSGLTSYSASKHAVVGFTESLNQELKVYDSKVKIFLITPGFIQTDIMQIGKKNGFPESLKFIVAKPDDAAATIVAKILAGEEHIVPDFSGKLMQAMNRLMPSVISQSNRFIARKIKGD